MEQAAPKNYITPAFRAAERVLFWALLGNLDEAVLHMNLFRKVPIKSVRRTL